MVTRVLGLLVGCLLGSTAWAWSPQGHQAVGAIADSLLMGTRAGETVRAVLATESLATASVWADCARQVGERPPYPYAPDPAHPECNSFETAAGERELVDYVERNLGNCLAPYRAESCHKQYHHLDIPFQRDHYETGAFGTSDHDLVAAIRACVQVLRGRPSPEPFRIPSPRVALRLLAHFVGDLHQPLHAGVPYLDDAGRVLDPARGPVDAGSNTRGSVLIAYGSISLHWAWDSIPGRLEVERFTDPGRQAAAGIPVTSGPLSGWPAAWATESLRASHESFAGLAFFPAPAAPANAARWSVDVPAGYDDLRERIQERQLVLAGARLAQLLEAIWPQRH